MLRVTQLSKQSDLKLNKYCLHNKCFPKETDLRYVAWIKAKKTLSFSRRTGKRSQIKMKLLLIAWVVASVFVLGTYLFFLGVDENNRNVLDNCYGVRRTRCRHLKLLGACIGRKLISDRPYHLALVTSWVSRSLAFPTFASSTMIIRISHAVKAVKIR